MHAMQSLLCRSTNETPHERLFSFQRKAMFGPALPSWLMSSGTKVLLCRFVRNKSDPMCDTVELISANQTYARVRTKEGRESTVSTSDLAPFPIQTGLIPNEDGSNPIERSILLHEPANCEFVTMILRILLVNKTQIWVTFKTLLVNKMRSQV